MIKKTMLFMPITGITMADTIKLSIDLSATKLPRIIVMNRLTSLNSC